MVDIFLIFNSSPLLLFASIYAIIFLTNIIKVLRVIVGYQFNFWTKGKPQLKTELKRCIGKENSGNLAYYIVQQLQVIASVVSLV
jgi:hypothetical protein